MMMRIALGGVLAALVALAGYRAGAFSAGGAGAAIGVGTIVFAVTGWPGAAVLFAFFLPATLLSGIGRARKRALRDIAKQGARDAWQVLANGGVAAAAALLAARGSLPFACAFAGAFAAASADTWGTEIGTLSRQPPVGALTLRPVPVGLSGGITLLGTLATLGGAVCVAVVAAFVGVAPLWPVAIGGLAGAAADSLLGASLQALRWCPLCEAACETNPHHCRTPTLLRRGVRWLNNDAVNFAATLCGALVALLLAGS
jgi:uncharacterized protein (TIGR00297 family)